MHWRNSNFQIEYFIAGKARTPDEAYRVLCELREERQMALDNVSRQISADIDDRERARLSTLIDAALDEREFIDHLIEKYEPLRQFRHLPDAEAHQAAQREQWRLELMFRAENFLIGQGFIPADQIEVMRLHPDWPAIHAHVVRVQQLMQRSAELRLPVEVTSGLLEFKEP